MAFFPINSYSSKKKCIDLYIADHKLYGKSEVNPHIRITGIMPDVFCLYDAIAGNMDKFYRRKNPGGKYAAAKGVQVSKQRQKFHSKFLESQMEAALPNGFIYAILGAFRALVGEKEDRKDVGENWRGLESTVSRSRSLGNSPQFVGKDANIWKARYMSSHLQR